MNASPMHRRAIAAILASVLTLAGCTNKATTVPAGQAPAATTNTNPAGTNTASAAPAAQAAQAPSPGPRTRTSAPSPGSSSGHPAGSALE